MKKYTLFALLFIFLFCGSRLYAQKKDKKKDIISTEGLDCDQISVSVNTSGVIKFSEPVNISFVGLVDNNTGEVVESLPFEYNNETHYKTIDLHDREMDFDIFIEFIRALPDTAIELLTLSEPCSRQIVIGQK